MNTLDKKSKEDLKDEVNTSEVNQSVSKGKITVLIIDDDEWILKILRHYVIEIGCNVISENNPIDGIAKAIKEKPELILLDVILPEIKGTLLLQMFKKIEVTKDIPIIILSGNLSKEIIGNSFKNGAAGFISKPTTKELLDEKINEVLSKHKTEKKSNESDDKNNKTTKIFQKEL